MLFKAKLENLTVCFAFAYMQPSAILEIKQGNNEVHNFNLSNLSIKTNYDFRIRMKLWCHDKDWSNWTKVQSWGNNTGTVSLSLNHVFRFKTRAWIEKYELTGHEIN